MSRARTPEDVLPRFVKDVAEHRIEVIRDDGVNRHLRFMEPGSSPYWFDVITWPGTLTIDGDMGTFVFKRLEDMFEFFRTDIQHGDSTGREHFINPSYWAEKLAATCRHGFEEYSADIFRERVKEEFDEWVESEKPDEDAALALRDEFERISKHLWECLEDEVLCAADDGEIRSYDAAMDFKFDVDGWEFSLRDSWEWNVRQYSFHFIWCCYAIVWGIKKYDAAKDDNPTGHLFGGDLGARMGRKIA